MSKPAFALAVFFCSLMLPTYHYAADTSTAVSGYWVGDTSILHIEAQAGQLRATIVALKDPVYLASEDIGTPGAPRTDNNNPDPELQGRALLGLNLLTAYRYRDGRWQGKIYDPESGNTYSSRMSVDRQGRLNMRGYIGAPMFGRTAVFMPLSDCSENVQVMLNRSQRQLEICEI
ncbi:MAG: DUF2147 domain-containing protein [bacterium]